MGHKQLGPNGEKGMMSVFSVDLDLDTRNMFIGKQNL